MVAMADTPVRHVRIPQPRWDAARAKASLQGTNRAGVINTLLEAWLRGDAMLEALVSAAVLAGSSQPSGQPPPSSSL